MLKQIREASKEVQERLEADRQYLVHPPKDSAIATEISRLTEVEIPSAWNFAVAFRANNMPEQALARLFRVCIDTRDVFVYSQMLEGQELLQADANSFNAFRSIAKDLDADKIDQAQTSLRVSSFEDAVGTENYHLGNIKETAKPVFLATARLAIVSAYETPAQITVY